MLISLVMATALLGSSDPEGVITTAPKGNQAVLVGASAPVADAVPTTSVTQIITPHGLTTDEQIDQWLASRSAEDRPFSDDGLYPEDDREIHGEVSASIGTGDFSAYSATVSLPIGESGRVDLSYSQSKNGYYGYPGYGYPGYGYPGYGHSGRSFGLGYEYGSSYGGPLYGDRSPFSSATRRERVFEQRDSQDVLRLGREPVTVED